MKICAISQYYWPEPVNVSDICEELARRGHEVTVITGRPNYPEGFIYNGYEGNKHADEIVRGVRVLRTSIYPRKNGVLNRVINYYSFPFYGKKLAKKITSSFDVVLIFQLSPILIAKFGLWYARRKKTPSFLYVIDIWPESLVASGIKKNTLIFKWFSRISKKAYATADKLAITSPGFNGYIADLIGKEIDAVYLPQYAEDIFSNENTELPEGYDVGKINLSFTGNVGAAQSVETIVRAAEILKHKSKIVFHIVGSGSELKDCKALARNLGLNNIIFHGRKPLEQMPAYYQASDAMLATFSSTPILAYTLPRKIQSYMAAGRPIIGAVIGEAEKVVREAKCGFCCETEDYKGLAEACAAFSELSEQKRNQLGESAKDYYEKHFSRQVFFEVLENELEQLKGTVHHD